MKSSSYARATLRAHRTLRWDHCTRIGSLSSAVGIGCGGTICALPAEYVKFSEATLFGVIEYGKRCIFASVSDISSRSSESLVKPSLSFLAAYRDELRGLSAREERLSVGRYESSEKVFGGSLFVDKTVKKSRMKVQWAVTSCFYMRYGSGRNLRHRSLRPCPTSLPEMG